MKLNDSTLAMPHHVSGVHTLEKSGGHSLKEICDLNSSVFAARSESDRTPFGIKRVDMSALRHETHIFDSEKISPDSTSDSLIPSNNHRDSDRDEGSNHHIDVDNHTDVCNHRDLNHNLSELAQTEQNFTSPTHNHNNYHHDNPDCPSPNQNHNNYHQDNQECSPSSQDHSNYHDDNLDWMSNTRMNISDEDDLSQNNEDDDISHSNNLDYCASEVSNEESKENNSIQKRGRGRLHGEPLDAWLDPKQRAKLKRQFIKNHWCDINKAPSWPPIKKNRYLDSDWKPVEYYPRPSGETKKSRRFLDSLCYLCEGVLTKRSTLGRRAGLGLFCQKPGGFEKGCVITEFVGWLVDREQAEAMRKRRRASHIVAVQKGFLYIDGVKDPYYGTGGGSFANDGSEFLGGPGNNAMFYHWFDDEIGRTRVFLRATRKIEYGEEIFVPYDKQYWQDNFEEQEENCPEVFRHKKLLQLQRRYKDPTIQSVQQLKQRQRELESQKRLQKLKRQNPNPPQNNYTKKPPFKRPMTAYLRFSVAKRREIIEKYPEKQSPKNFAEISRMISEEWKSLADSQKQIYIEEAQQEYLLYIEKKKKWDSHTQNTQKNK